MTAGWVIETEMLGVTKTGKPWVSQWYGPNHGWGTTYGSDSDNSVKVFQTRQEAEEAYRSVYGRYWRTMGARGSKNRRAYAVRVTKERRSA